VEHVREVVVGIKIVVKKLVSDGFDAIIEGAHFYGAVIEELRATNSGAEIDATFAHNKDPAELRKRVEDKAASRAQGGRSEALAGNIQTMLTIQNFLMSDARSHRIRVIAAN
jgi:2-phosphoglycerate kinase